MDYIRNYLNLDLYDGIIEDDVITYVKTLPVDEYKPELTYTLWNKQDSILNMDADYVKKYVLSNTDRDLYMIFCDGELIVMAINDPKIAMDDYINQKVIEKITEMCEDYFKEYLKPEDKPKEGDEI